MLVFWIILSKYIELMETLINNVEGYTFFNTTSPAREPADMALQATG